MAYTFNESKSVNNYFLEDTLQVFPITQTMSKNFILKNILKFKSEIQRAIVLGRLKKVTRDIEKHFEYASKVFIESDCKNEYYLYSSFSNMVLYILHNELVEYKDFLFKLFKFWGDVLQFDGQLDEEQYSSQLETLEDRLFDLEDEFYTKIYNPTHEYDKTIIKINNILLG